jgi:hypothetical protein
MISYKDMTFCNSSCGNIDCYRKLTPQVVNDAEVWWGGEGAPIGISNLAPICAQYVEEKDYEQES